MKMLFVGFSKSRDQHAYNHRIRQLEQHCKELGADTNLLFLGDLFFRSPVFVQVLNLPFVLRLLRGFDVISAEGHGPAYFFAIAKPLLRSHTIIVYDVHSDAQIEGRLMVKGRFDLGGLFSAFQMRLTEHLALKRIDYFVTAWPDLKQRLLSRGRRIKSENIELVLNGVDVQLFKPQNKSNCVQTPHTFLVAYAGSYGKIEGVEPLIDAAEKMKREDIHFEFIGFQEKDLNKKREIQEKLGPKVTLVDWLQRDELIDELQKADVLVIPADASTREEFENRSGLVPTKFAEFLALGKPVIVTRIDGTSKIVKEFECGFVCEPNAESIAEAIRRAKGTSRETLSLKGANGRKFAEAELDYIVICKRYLQFLDRIGKARGLAS